MIRCDACRTLNDDNARSCIGCGTSLWLSGRAPTGDINTRTATQERQPAYAPPTNNTYTAPPPAVQHAPVGAQPARAGYRCPYCRSNTPPFTIEKITEGGWIVFAMMLLFCFPLFWIGLLMKESQQFCSHCRSRVG